MKGERMKAIINTRRAKVAERAGFTLIEILVVVIIIALLTTVTSVKVIEHIKKSRIATTRANIENLKTAVRLYELEVEKKPESLNDLLIEGDEDWPGPFLEDEELPKDAWGNDFKYEIRGKLFRITSAGPDKKMGTEDDIWK
jgi:general secretion pathway protein G